jgi:predicted phosphoribosyltransferase
VCAVPVGSISAVHLVRPYADETVCLSTPVEFGAVGNFYRDFSQVGDAEVVAALHGARRGAYERAPT